jgi:[acyl-carrier-protein] S-malonyltransferase
LHVHRPVRWRDSLELLAEQHPDAVFVEVGPRAVLFNLLSRSWLPVQKRKTDSSGDLKTDFAALVEELSHGA